MPLVVRSTRARTVAVVLALLAPLAVISAPATASASSHRPSRASRHERPATPDLIARAVRTGRVSEARGALLLTYALTAPRRLPAAYRSSTPWSGTLPLLQLQSSLPALGSSRVAGQVRTQLRAPNFGCPGAKKPLPQHKSTAHFYVQYRGSALTGLTVGAYTSALETTWKTEIKSFGWAKPPKDPESYPPGGRYPVKITNLSGGLYGYVSGTNDAGNNPATPWNDKDAVASCMVLNQDFVPFPGTPVDAMHATIGHEFNHSLQFGYGALTGFGKVAASFVEGGATWMEDEVFDGANDNYNYLWPALTEPMASYEPSFPYPYWVVFRAMTEPFGTGTPGGGQVIMRTFWEQLSKGASTNLAAMNKALKGQGSSLAQSFHDAAIAIRFYDRGCDGVTKARYCLSEGPDYPAGFSAPDDNFTITGMSGTLDKKLANDFAAHWIGIPENDFNDITVDVTSGKGRMRVSVACRTMSTITVTDADRDATSSAQASLGGIDLSGCTEAVLVISNVQQTSPTPRTVTRSGYHVELS